MEETNVDDPGNWQAIYRPRYEGTAVWMDLLAPRVVAASTSADVRGRLAALEDFIDRLETALRGCWVDYELGGGTAFEYRPKPKYWWIHFPLRSFLENGNPTGSTSVSRIMEDSEVSARATEYLAMPWARHPTLDWVLLDCLMYFSAATAIQRLRSALAGRAGWSLRRVMDDNERTPTWKLRQLARSHQAELRLKTAAAVAGFGFMLPVVTIAAVATKDDLGTFGTILFLAAIAVIALSTLGIVLALGGKAWNAFTRSQHRLVEGETAAAASLGALEREAEQWTDLYDMLGNDAVPVGPLREGLHAIRARTPKEVDPVMIGLIDRIASLDGAVWVRSPS